MAFSAKILFFLFTSALVAVYSAPVGEETTLAKRGAVLTAQFATETEANGAYILENNLWGMSAATSRSQSSRVTAVNDHTITWHTTYTWTGGPSQVKSFANLDMRQNLGKQLSAVESVPTVWNWVYSSASSDLVADVSYDLWLSNQADSSGASSTSTFEIMIWLSTRGGAGPAGSQIGTASEITNFNQDLKPFFTFLTSTQGVPSSQFLVQAQAGTEPFVGSATLTTNSYSLAIN
ncbi:unnamed protein product [Somion occarium]|uniref:Glycoside hydrolase family 12 protein n=1 Tax=Somion occarium TaxID=3059160 RepID=A0ABP1D5U3_9APHY